MTRPSATRHIPHTRVRIVGGPHGGVARNRHALGGMFEVSCLGFMVEVLEVSPEIDTPLVVCGLGFSGW